MIRIGSTYYLWSSSGNGLSEVTVKQNGFTYTFESPSAARVDLVLALVTLDDVSPALSARFRCT